MDLYAHDRDRHWIIKQEPETPPAASSKGFMDDMFPFDATTGDKVVVCSLLVIVALLFMVYSGIALGTLIAIIFLAL